MAHRSLAEIDREIASHEAALRRLHAERREITRDKNAELIAAFDAGKSIAEISEAKGIAYSKVQGILYRAGRTQAGRTAIALRIRDAVGQGAPA